MSLGHGAKIVTNGLVFAYDMGPNPGANKSWKGKPTTNIFSAGRNTDNSASLFTYYFGTGASGTIGSEYLGKGITAKTATITASTNSYTNFQVYMGNVSLTGGSTYTVSAMVWTNVAFTCRIGAIRNGSPWTAYVPLNEVSLSSGWNFISSVGTYASTVTDARFQLDFGRAPVGTTIKVIKPQIEQSNYATPYVNGTRSNTESLLDWTGNNTITINGLTYNSDGTFNYYGTNGTGLILPGTNFSLNEQTIECWCYASNFVQNGFMFEKTTNNLVNTQYSFFFNNNATHLYYRTYGLSTTDLTRTTSNSGVINNQWNHMVATFDGSTKKIYVNGAQKASAAVTGTITQNTTGSAYIGTYGNFAGYPYNGKIGVTRIYNRALTADEITANFNALRGRYGI
jgi:hypothetical protein